MLSIVINIKNGEKYLELCLNALNKFLDVVILDNYSTDSTLTIANKFTNVTVYQSEFCGMGVLRNIAASYAKYDWVMFIDCDEVLDANLVNTLLTMSFDTKTVYQFLRKNYYNNKLINGAGWENDWVCRLYNKKETKFSQNDVHESIMKDGFRVKQIRTGVISHFPYNSVSDLLSKMKFYSELYARQNFNKKSVNIYTLPFRSLLMFIKCYIIKRGFLYGFEGFLISCANSFGVFTKYAKLWELYNKQKFALALEVSETSDLKAIIGSVLLQSKLPNLLVIIENVNIVDELSNLLKNLNIVIPYIRISNKNAITSDLLISNQVDYLLLIKNNSILTNKNLLLSLAKKYKNQSLDGNNIFELIAK